MTVCNKKLSNKEARKRYETADILIDQLLAGWYGGLAVELMALGKPVICYIREDDLKYIPKEMRDELPIINANTLYTQARLRDGSILVLSGLTRTEKINSKAGMPWLSRVPVLGYMVGGENNINRQKQLVIVIETETETGENYSNLSDPALVKTLAAQVNEGSKIEVPDNALGFDQWLLGK